MFLLFLSYLTLIILVWPTINAFFYKKVVYKKVVLRCSNFECTWRFSIPINVHAKNIETQKFLLRKSSESFDTGIVKKLRNVYIFAQVYESKSLKI